MPTQPPQPPPPRTFKPALILHGGAGAIYRSTLPPDLYARYHASLLSYLRSTYAQLKNGATALDAAVHAVSFMEDDELFNCGRGSVFTSAGTIEMEASVMVTSVRNLDSGPGAMKRGAGVIQIRNVKNPIKLAREALLRTGYDEDGQPNGDGGNMHCQMSGPYVERTLAKEWGLEFEPDEYFWTKRRWEEHRRGLEGKEKEEITMSQGTVGCVCLDQWGDLAVATSTGGMTNKKPGRVGDTPTLGAGFWAEAWDVEREETADAPVTDAAAGMVYRPQSQPPSGSTRHPLDSTSPFIPWLNLVNDIRSLLGDCIPHFRPSPQSSPPYPYTYAPIDQSPPPPYEYEKNQPLSSSSSSTSPITKGSKTKTTRRAIALSGTGNGDSFLRINAARTVSAMLRFSSPQSYPQTLAEAVTAIAGPGGELERSAGKRWGRTSEGQGGIIGIEVDVGDRAEAEADAVGEEKGLSLRRGKVVFDFNCGGMFRAWMEEVDGGKGERERVMVFREEYR
ncbi:hypothetical protein VTN00DRAFT_4880 [Thermoascus crustaceus]|uniref:uncharacterized protein n=1 Tax=Thermoascus crustaceus TaxID=5088 RepID=UPI0037438E51